MPQPLMHLARLDLAGKPCLALIDDDRFLLVRAAMADAPEDLSEFLRVTDWASLTATAKTTPGWQTLVDIAWLPPLGQASRIFCVGKNYAAHAKEMGMADPKAIAPDIFVRFASSFSGHDSRIEFPEIESTFDFEGELAVVIGKQGREISEERALEHVFGLTAANDGSLRRLQKRTSQFTLGKNFDRSGALGPQIKPIGAFPTPLSLGVQTRVNGQLMQDGTSADMIFDIPSLVATISTITELMPGDIILTGTPAGVGAGRTPPLFLKDGDCVEVAIEGLPLLRSTVSATKISPR